MKKLFCLFLLLPAWGFLSGQRTYPLEGRVLEEQGSRPVAGASVYVPGREDQGTVSDREGRFMLYFPAGTYTVVGEFLGFEPGRREIRVPESQSLTLYLREKSQQIEQVVITAHSARERVAEVQIGVEKIEMAEMSRIPALFGERDLIRSIQLLPGIKSDGDGSSGYQVRGGTSAQNVILLDDATVYNAGHLIGIFSPFNDDALTNASLYKGQIPAQYGGVTSSVFDIQTKNGNLQDYRVNGSLGLLFAKLHVEGPMVRDRVSFFVAARRSYFDLFLQMTDDYKNTVMNFYDLNAKVQYSVNENNLLFVSFFAGQDNMGLDDLMTMNWGNRSTTLRWLHRLDDRLHLNSSFIYSGYDSKTGMDLLNTDLSFDGYVNQGGIKESFTWTPDQRHTFRFGVQSTLLSLKSAEWTYNGLHEREKRDAWGNTLWLNDEWTVSERLQVSAGVRFNGFSALGGSPYYRLDESGDILDTLHYKRGAIVTTHMALKPRLSMNFRIDERKSLKLGYSRTSQNIHAIRPTTMARPFDRYTISSNLVRPQRADQVSLGWAALSPGNRYEFSVEGYFKSIDHVYDFKEGKSFSSEIEIERIILGGRGRAYGVEAYARKNTGRLTGWLAYTLSWSKNKIPGINGNRWYTAGNDRRHDISLVGLFELDRGWQMAAAWVYNTGQALSAPSGKYELDGQTIYYYAERNGYRAPSYHRLDSSFTHTKQKKNHTREWTFGIYNAYCRYNPYLIFFENDDDKPSGTRTVQYALFGIIPSVSYSFKF